MNAAPKCDICGDVLGASDRDFHVDCAIEQEGVKADIGIANHQYRGFSQTWQTIVGGGHT